jgi:hypothetical protein
MGKDHVFQLKIKHQPKGVAMNLSIHQNSSDSVRLARMSGCAVPFAVRAVEEERPEREKHSVMSNKRKPFRVTLNPLVP